MCIKNNMAIAGNGSSFLSDENAQNFAQDNGTRNDGNLYFDQSIYKKGKANDKKKGKKKKKRADSVATDNLSDDSDLSDDAFLNQINSQWGEEESELRQAIFF